MFIIEGYIKEDEIRITSPTILAVMIYAYAREYMYDHFISKVEHKYGMDTDSLFLKSSELTKIDPLFIGKCPGQVRLELPPQCKGIYVAKKMYCNYTVNPQGREQIIKIKFKGVNKGDKFIPLRDVDRIKNLIKDQEWVQLNEIWDSYETAHTLEIFREILKGKKVYVLCSQIRKTFRNSESKECFIVRGRFVLKSFPYKTKIGTKGIL